MLQRLEEEEVKNLENKEHLIMGNGEFDTMMQHQEEDKVQKLMEKEQQSMTSTPDREGFASRSACTFLAPFTSVFHTPELGSHLKSNNLGNGRYVFLRGLFTPSTSGI